MEKHSPVASQPGLRSTLLIIIGAFLIALLARGRELASFSFLLTLWMVIEGARGQRRWSDMGFRLDNLWSGLKRNAPLIGLVGLILQGVFVLVARFLHPPLWVQVQARFAAIRLWLPSLPLLLAFILPETLLEEIGCRGFVQGRLAPHWGTSIATLLGVLFFAGFHWQVRVDVFATLLDLALIAVDGAIYGWIFARSENVLVAWLAHLFADLVSLPLLLLAQTQSPHSTLLWGSLFAAG